MASEFSTIIKVGMNSTDFEKSASQVNRKIRILDSGFKAASAEAKAFGESADTLKKKHEILTQKIQIQDSKVSKLKEAYEKSKKETGENSKETDKLAIQYNKAVAEMNKMQGALNSVEDDLDKTSKGFKDNGKSIDDMSSKSPKLSKLSGVLAGVASGVLAVGAALVGMGIKGVSAADDLQGALNDLQASTGATTEEIEGMEDALIRIYENNFGESFEDIADSMATVKQVTGLTGKELESATQNALMMRDTFEFDVKESVNAVNSLMKQFGITSERAYELIAIGAQNGANKNGDLLDTLNEYAPQFKALGHDAEMFLETLIEGSENGAFSIDKVGDAVKEFNIRSKDMSDSSADAFESLGLNAEEMFEAFAKGGDSAQTAFQIVTEELDAIQDPLKKNEIGIALFGTQFEDLEAGVLDVFMNIDSKIGESDENIRDITGTLESINNVKYDTFGEAMQGIGRQLETNVLIPIGDKILPKLNELSTWFNEHLPGLQEGSETVFGKIGEVFNNLKPIIEDVKAFIVQFVADNEESFNEFRAKAEELFSSIKEFITSFIEFAKYVWENYGEEITAIIQAQFDVIMSIFSLAFDLISDLLKVFSKVLTGDWEGALEALKTLGSNLLSNITDLFSDTIDLWLSKFKLFGSVLGDGWQETWNNVKSFFTGIMDGIVEIGRNRINSIIDLVNKMISLLNGISFDVPGVVQDAIGFDSFGFDIDKIPRLNVGTNLVPNDMLAYIHKNEAVVPADMNPYNPDAQTYNSDNQVSIIIQNMNVRDNNDIKKIGRELFNLQQQKNRGLGYA